MALNSDEKYTAEQLLNKLVRMESWLDNLLNMADNVPIDDDFVVRDEYRKFIPYRWSVNVRQAVSRMRDLINEGKDLNDGK